MNTSSMPSHLRPYGRMYMDTIFASPIRIDDGNYINHDDVIQKLDLDIISYDASLGYQASFREYIVVTIKVEVQKILTIFQYLFSLIEFLLRLRNMPLVYTGYSI